MTVAIIVSCKHISNNDTFYAKLTPTEVYESIATCGRVLIYRLSPASSRVKFLNFGAKFKNFFFVIVIYIYVSGFAV